MYMRSQQKKTMPQGWPQNTDYESKNESQMTKFKVIWCEGATEGGKEIVADEWEGK